MTPHGIIVLSNHDGLAFPPHSRDPRPARSQPPFGVGQNLNPYPCDYYTAFASSGILYPLIHRYTLAGDLPLPNDGAYHVPHEYHPGGVRLCLSAGDTTSARGDQVPPLPGHVPFGSSLSASLACWLLRRLNSSSPELTLPSNPSSRPPCEAGSRSVPSRFRCRLKRAEATLSRELRTPELPPTHVPVRYRWQNTGSSLINTRARVAR